MKVRLNTDKKTVDKIKAGLKAKGGYCPCMVEKTDDTKCMCRDFREKIVEKDFEGYCHCKLYYKHKG